MNKETFCAYPFIHISTERNGAYTCCGASMEFSKHNVYTDDVETAWNDEYFRKLRIDLVNGIKNDNCKVCWLHESQGIESRRQRINIAYEDLVTTIHSDGHVDNLPIQIHTRVENICNLKCITCNHYHSSQHEKEVNTFKEQDIELSDWFKFVDEKNIIRINPETAKNGSISANLKKVLTNANKLEIEGGEPLLASMTWEILDYCIEHGHTDVEIEIVSNLTSLTDQMLDRLKHFTNLNIWISWDHIDSDKFKFIRYPANYENFLSVFNKIIQYKNIKLGISFTSSIFNIFDVPSIINHFESLAQQNLIQQYVIFRHVFQPDYFSSSYLEKDQRIQLISMFKEFREYSLHYKILQQRDIKLMLEDIDKLLSKEPDNFDKVVRERSRMLKIYDNIRHTEYKKLFPYIKEY
jgi:organic radical activating enzyme